MVSSNKPRFPVFVAIYIERYVDRCADISSPQDAIKAVVPHADGLISNRPEDSLAYFADYFDIVQVDAYDRYEDDEKGLTEQGFPTGSPGFPSRMVGFGEDLGDEDRYCVELKIIARFDRDADSREEAVMSVMKFIDEKVWPDCQEGSIEEYATNFAVKTISL